MLFCLWDGAYKRTLAVNRRVAHLVAVTGFFSRYLNGSLLYVRRHITVDKMCLSASLNKTFASFLQIQAKQMTIKLKCQNSKNKFKRIYLYK